MFALVEELFEDLLAELLYTLGEDGQLGLGYILAMRSKIVVVSSRTSRW
jgi:hypothetical protein